MNESHPAGRIRPARTMAAAAVLTALTAAALCGCGGSDAEAQERAGAVASATPRTSAAATPAPGTVAPTATHVSPSLPLAARTSVPTTAASPRKPPAAPVPAPDPATDDTLGCDHKMPISPDEVAVYRYTPEGGALNLIVRSGAWGCSDTDTDGPAFETTGKEYDLPLDQAAYVTATNPITTSTTNQHIGVQELLDWLEAHPDAGLVFRYHTAADGTVDTLEQEFTP